MTGPNLKPTWQSAFGQIEQLGKGLSPDLFKKTFKLYAELLEPGPPDGVQVLANIAYGPHERHVMDLHIPQNPPRSPMPAVIFFHGGGFVGGDKSLYGGRFYANIANYFARNGIIGINASYRLAPEFTWPAASEDVAAAAQWTRAHISEHGGDPDQIIISGHSSGATHAAGYCLHRDFQSNGEPSIAGAILLSGQYGIVAGAADPRQTAYYGEDESTYAGASTLGNVGAAAVPAFIIFSEFDSYPFQNAGLQLIGEIAARDQACPWFKQVLGHNHMSEILSLGTGDQSLGPELLQFIHYVTGG
ncbi:MAG: alpha/beta hydrolase [Rhodospirillales bacterium]|nr:alpha/beta hydrolase [Rhodospirillales bacterium]